MYSVIGLALFHICVSRAIVRESVLGANFSANGLWPDKNLSGNKFPYLQGYWNISNVKLEEVRRRRNNLQYDTTYMFYIWLIMC